MDSKYYLGIDLGTNSIGWAATNDKYELIRLKGKTAFGARIFSDASDAKTRRAKRASKRRIARRKYRIYLLNTLFAEEINKYDNTFFARLSNSTYVKEDKQYFFEDNSLLFKTKKEEAAFYNHYPTIWHLRNDMIHNKADAFSDIRNVYLAIHHIIKYRGNFLTNGELNYTKFDYSIFDDLNAFFEKYCDDKNLEYDGDFLPHSNYESLIGILDSNESLTEKKRQAKALFNVFDIKKQIDFFVDCVCGSDVNLSKICIDTDFKFSFSKDFTDDTANFISTKVGQDYEVIAIAKKIYDFIALKKLIGNSDSISAVMVDIYENHKKDLFLLKKAVIEIDAISNSHNLYNMIFKEKTSGASYAGYIDNKVNLKDFNSEILNVLEQNKEHISAEVYKILFEKAKAGNLLKKISLAFTSLIPHQLHLNDLKEILKNAANYFDFIGNVSNKIVELFLFRVPYYYGPLDSRSKWSNVERKSNETVTPWNISSIIDDNKTREKFMNRLTNSCRYLIGCTVMPKSSLLFEDYSILNRLNEMNINGSNLTSVEKEELYTFIILRNKTSIDDIKRYLCTKKYFKNKQAIIIDKTSLDIPFEAPTHCYLSKHFDIEKDYDLLERAIVLGTIYADDKQSVVKTLNKEYPELLDSQIDALKKIKCNKWASLSKELFTDIYYVDDNGETYNIIRLLKETNKNFQQLLFDEKYNFNKIISEYNKESIGLKTKSEQIKELIDSIPAITRRPVNQALAIIDDIIKASKKVPSKIFIEVTRNEDTNGSTNSSRKEELTKFINTILADKKSEYYNHTISIKEELEREEIDNLKLKGKHLYLYFKQLGYDMYTGDKIDINDVLNTNAYDIDHIVPQSLIKDDSLDNMVLVSSYANRNIKKDFYPIPVEIKTQKVLNLWSYLYNKGAISEKKYANLTRQSEISLDELEQFVNRQINVVDYSNVVLKNILEMKYPDSKIVFSKSHYPSFVRKELQIVKNRDLNDAHHAVDAYLNVVCGDILTKKFSNVREIYMRKVDRDSSATFNMERVLLNEFNNLKLHSLIKSNCNRRDALITFKQDFVNGAFYNETIYGKGPSKLLVPLHTKGPMKDTSKYGGYSSLSSSGFIVIEYEKKGKKVRRIEVTKLMYDLQGFTDYDYLNLYAENMQNAKILCRFPLNQKIEYNGSKHLLYSNNSDNNKLKIASQNYLDCDVLAYVSKANSLIDIVPDDADEFVHKNKNGEEFVISKEMNEKVFAKIAENSWLKTYDNCKHICSLRNGVGINNLSICDQIKSINELIIFFSRNCEKSKLVSFVPSIKNVDLRVNKNVGDADICLIDESPSGLFSYKRKI